MHWGERTWPEIEKLNHNVVVLPLASMEQHGHHLPVLTDTMICTEIVRRAEAELGDTALFLPPLWVGASDHHRAFPGTVSISNQCYVRVLVDMLESLIGGGFRRILLLNAHGGNEVPGNMAIYDVQLRHRDKSDLWLVLGSWMTIAADQIAAIDELEQKHVTHSCELETSMIQHLRPELVKLKVARGANIPFESNFYSPDFSGPSRVSIARGFEGLSETGALGHPEIATADKGAALFDAVAAEVVAFVREFATWPPLAPG